MSFFGSFTGSTQRRDINRANAQATTALAQGKAEYDANMDRAGGFLDRSMSEYDALNPWIQGGSNAQGMWDNAMGLNGQGAAAGAASAYFDNPVFSRINDQSQNALLRLANARGTAGSGAAIAAGSNTAFGNYRNWLDSLRSRGSEGGQFATQRTQGRVGALQGQAGLAQDRAQMGYGYGATRAGNAINAGNAVAGTRGIGVNNLLGLVGTAAQAYGASLGMPTGGGPRRSGNQIVGGF